jgi:hypothetical protein
MNRFWLALVSLLLVVSLGGCATMGNSKTVKCPACGYEFEVPQTN